MSRKLKFFKNYFFSCQTLITTPTTTTTTIPISTTACLNIDESYCNRFISFLRNNCNKEGLFMGGYRLNIYCCRTCRQIDRNCFDTKFDCNTLGNFCNILDSYNPHPCPATCNKC